jgi:hypothetical protein
VKNAFVVIPCVFWSLWLVITKRWCFVVLWNAAVRGSLERVRL